MDGSGNKISSGVKNTKEILPDGKRVTAKSVLKLKPLKHHHNTTLSCQAKNTSDKSVKTAQIKIEVNSLNTQKHFRICHHCRCARTHSTHVAERVRATEYEANKLKLSSCSIDRFVC